MARLFMTMKFFFFGLASGALIFCSSTSAEDWLRFRGNAGSGVSTSTAPTPVEWNEEKNISWKLDLPGPGHSSPIIVGDKVFLTCWTGYGLDRNNPGEQKDLKRHLLCINRTDGKILWNKATPAELPEDTYSRMFAEHGYATHTPVSDGNHVYVFYGKSGVLAYDMDGNEVWKTSVGTNLNNKSWGSSSSPILHGDAVIVAAGMESGAIVALDKKTGKELWQTPAGNYLGSTWGTPLIVKNKDGREDIVVLVPGEVWGINPANGKLRWYLETAQERSACASAVAEDGIVFAMGEAGGTVAFSALGEKGNPIDKSNVLWTSGDKGRIPTPVVAGDRLYIVNGGIVSCINSKDGSKIYGERLQAPKSGDDSGESTGRRRRGGGSDYSSPIAADGKLYYVTRKGVVYVMKMGDSFEQLATNSFTDGGDFSASPSSADGQIFFRSTKALYCIANSQE